LLWVVEEHLKTENEWNENTDIKSYSQS